MEEITPAKVVKSPVKTQDKVGTTSGGSATALPPPDVPFEYQWIKLQKFFDLTPMELDAPVEKRLKAVYEYALRETGTQDFQAIETFLTHMKTTIGSPTGGNTLLDKIWQYSVISSDIKHLEAKRETL